MELPMARPVNEADVANETHGCRHARYIVPKENLDEKRIGASNKQVRVHFHGVKESQQRVRTFVDDARVELNSNRGADDLTQESGRIAGRVRSRRLRAFTIGRHCGIVVMRSNVGRAMAVSKRF